MMNCRITNAKILNTLNTLTLIERERCSIEPLSNGFYKASVEVSGGAGGWVLKTDKSTFFPDSWGEIKVMQEIQSAKNNMIGNPIVNTSKKTRVLRNVVKWK